MDAILKITEPTGRTWEARLVHGSTYSIGRARENDIVLDDRRVSRKHAFIFGDGKVFKLIDGHLENGQLIRSVNHVFVNGNIQIQYPLTEDDIITIGESSLQYHSVAPEAVGIKSGDPVPELAVAAEGDAHAEKPQAINYDDAPLGTPRFRSLSPRLSAAGQTCLSRRPLQRLRRSRTCGEKQRSSNFSLK